MLLYSFRRCPYAIRARMALHASGVPFELIEVSLRDKPADMLAASPKGSVPVLVLPDGSVIDESWDIMLWALHQHDPEGWLGVQDAYVPAAQPLVITNDTDFKAALDRYKYADRQPAQSRSHYRAQGERFLRELELRLNKTHYLLADTLTIADAALFPFIRQFAAVDEDWFAQSPYPLLRDWLTSILDTPRFAEVMRKPLTRPADLQHPYRLPTLI